MKLLTFILTLFLCIPAWPDADGPGVDTTKAWFPGSGYSLDGLGRLKADTAQSRQNLNVAHYVIGSASSYGIQGWFVATVPGSVTSATVTSGDILFDLSPYDLGNDERVTVQIYGESPAGTIFSSTTGTIPTITAKGTPFNRYYGDDANLPAALIADATPLKCGISRIDTHGLASLVLNVSAAAAYSQVYSTTNGALLPDTPETFSTAPAYVPMPATYHVLISNPRYP